VASRKSLKGLLKQQTLKPSKLAMLSEGKRVTGHVTIEKAKPFCGVMENN
jgi:hypothetical protein